MGDGVADDRTAIQAAIDSIRDAGGTVFIPRGVYRLSLDREAELGLKFYSNMQIIGAGRGNTVLKWQDDVTTASQHYLLAGAGGFVENVTIADLDFEIDGNKQGRGNATFQIRGEGIEIDGKNIVIRNMYIHDVLGEGIDCDVADGLFISHVIVENTGGNGIHCSDARVRHVMISNCITRNCAHGRRHSGNRRYGGLVLRGSDIYVDQHISVDDAQIASIEGQGRGESSMIALSGVAGRSESMDAEGFRVGMQGRVVLSHCRSMLPNSNRNAYRANGFDGSLHLQHCFAENGDGVAYEIAMKGALSIESCEAVAHSGGNRTHGYRLEVEGRGVIRNSTSLDSNAADDGSLTQDAAAIEVDGPAQPGRTDFVITGNRVAGGINSVRVSDRVGKGFVHGNICDGRILLDGSGITCVSNVTARVIDNGSNNTVESNYQPSD